MRQLEIKPLARWICAFCGAVHHYKPPTGCQRRNCGRTILIERLPGQVDRKIDVSRDPEDVIEVPL